ncbi:MAG: tetratricopeptide repeat protein [Rhodothermales bacterium]
MASLRQAIGVQVFLLLAPLALLSVSLVWAPNCAYWSGLAFFGLFTIPSVLLGVSLAYLIKHLAGRRGRRYFVLSGIAIVLFGVAYDLAFHPQFFTYNHVFGGVLGPLYDEEIVVRPGLIWFRVLTILWAVFAVSVATGVRVRRARLAGLAHFDRRWHRVASSLSALGIGALYLFSAPLGINTPEWYLQRQLGSSYSTPHFEIFYGTGKDVAVRSMADLLEFHFARLSEVLDEEGPHPISVYVYPDPFTRERLTGARFTSVAPVWLPDPQMHVLTTDSDRVLTHELVHVFARSFGMPFVRASPSVGLVEGLAVAFEAPSGPSPDDQVLASLLDTDADATALRIGDIASRMTPLGFWTGRGSVAYTAAGSFIAYLADAYGAGPLKRAYRTGRIEASYGKRVEDLSDEWLASLQSRTYVSAASGPVSRRRFAVPSLFERRCPHYIPPSRREYLDALRALASGDTTVALQSAGRAIELDSSATQAIRLYANLHFVAGRYDRVIGLTEIFSDDDMPVWLALRAGDAYALTGDLHSARDAYERARLHSDRFARRFAAHVALREKLIERDDVLKSYLRRDSAALLEQAGSATDTLGAALILAQETPSRAIELLHGNNSWTDVSPLDTDAMLLGRLWDETLMLAAWSARNFPLAAESAKNVRLADIAAGDPDGARLAAYQRDLHRWLAERSR